MAEQHTGKRNRAVPQPAAKQAHEAEAQTKPSLKDLLLSEEARMDDLISPRRRLKPRPPVAFD
jgi:hypothetical protein